MPTRPLLRPLVPALPLLVVVTCVGCLGDEGEPPAPPSPDACERDRDCSAGEVCSRRPDEASGVCVQVACFASADCDDGEVCHVRSGVCLAPLACVDDGACGAGERCLIEGDDARCVSDTQLPAGDGCVVVPRTPALVEGAVAAVDVVALGVEGRPAVARAFSLVASAGVAQGSGPFEYQAACDGAAPCTVELTARDDGGLACTASLLVLPPVLEPAVRVVLVDEGDGRPIPDALVTLRTAGDALEAVTDERGVVVFDDVAAADVLTLSALPDEHDWHSFVEVPGSDLLVVTRASVRVDEVAGVRARADFTSVTTFGDIEIAIGGLSLERGLSGRFSLATVVGDLVEQRVFIEDVTSADGGLVTVPLGMELHVGTSPVTDVFVAASRPGRRVLWALAGKVLISQTGPLIEATFAGRDGAAAAELLRFARRFEHVTGPSVVVERSERPDAEDQLPLHDWPLPLVDATQLSAPAFPRVDLTVTVPRLPCVSGADDEDCVRLPSGLASVTALTPLGQVPLGAAHADDDPVLGDALVLRDGVVSEAPAGEGAVPDGDLALSYAPPHDGLEGAPRVLTTMAFDVDDPGGRDSAVSFTQALAPRSGSPEVEAAPFLPLAKGTFAQGASSGALVLDERAEGADLHRFHLVGGDGAEWHVWLLGERTSVSLDELLPAGVAPRHHTAALQALDVGDVLPGDAPSSTAALFAPDGTSLAELRRYTRRFSSAPCPLAGGPPSACVTVDE